MLLCDTSYKNEEYRSRKEYASLSVDLPTNQHFAPGISLPKSVPKVEGKLLQLAQEQGKRFERTRRRSFII